MSRIAICISSQLREVENTLDNIKKTFEYFFYKSEIDFFVYGSEVITERFYLIAESKNIPIKHKIKDDVIDIINKKLNPKSIFIETENAMENNVKFLFKNNNIFENIKNANFGAISQFYFAEKSIELKKNYEVLNGFVYDFVIRLRSDIIFCDPINIDRDYFYKHIIHKNVITVLYHNKFDGIFEVGDICFMGKSQIMNTFHENMTQLSISTFVDDNENTNSIVDKIRIYSRAEWKWAYLGHLKSLDFDVVGLNEFSWGFMRRWYNDRYQIINVNNCGEHNHFLFSIHEKCEDCVYKHNINRIELIDYLKTIDIFRYKSYKEVIDMINKKFNI